MEAIELLPSPWRGALEQLLLSVERDLLIAAPYIKATEANWTCDALTRRRSTGALQLRVLTDVRSDSVLGGSLDIGALKTFADSQPGSMVVNLPRLHAKVYAADSQFAIVGSGNLTPSGLDFNYEYAVGLRDPTLVTQLRADLESYARIGTVLDSGSLADLMDVGDELSSEYQRLQRSASSNIRRQFSQKLRRANLAFLRAQVGSRSANSLFGEAIVYVLSKGPLVTHELHPRIQSLLPDLCDDSLELVINGEHFGKRWKHAVRNAQQSLKRMRVIEFDGRRWRLVRGGRP